MKVINLINLEASDVKYTSTVFPDGEPHISLGEIDRKTDYKVVCRISNPNDLFIVGQVGDILNRQDVEWELDIMYLMSMRMDRVINFGEAFTLKMVANIINGLAPVKVRIFHAHSSKTLKLINNAVDMETDYNNVLCACVDDYINATVCYPDAGAYERYWNKYGSFYRMPLIMKKVRDLDNKGVIKSLDFVEKANDVGDHIMITDDLCDAGGTFCWAAKVLHAEYPGVKLGICVRHLVNPVGLKNLAETFDNVYITNSYKDWGEDAKEMSNVFVWDVTELYKRDNRVK